MPSLESDKMTALWTNESLTFTFYETFSNSLPIWTTFVKEFFDSLPNLESDKMTAFWPDDISTFTFYETFLKSIPNWTTFVKEVFWFNA